MNVGEFWLFNSIKEGKEMRGTLKKTRINEIKDLYMKAKNLSDDLIKTGENDTITAIILTSATLNLKDAFREAENEIKSS